MTVESASMFKHSIIGALLVIILFIFRTFIMTSGFLGEETSEEAKRPVLVDLSVENARATGLLNLSDLHTKQYPCSTPLGFLGLPFCDIILNQSYALVRSLSERREIIPHQSQPFVQSGAVLNELAPKYSVIISAYNQEGILGTNIGRILNLTEGSWELIVVLDGPFDNSQGDVQASIEKWFHTGFRSQKCSTLNTDQCHLSCLTRFLLVIQATAVDETMSNNIGMRATDIRAEYFILMQPDMHISERGWNIALSLPMQVRNDVFAVSARCAHDFDESNQVGLCGPNVGQGFTQNLNIMRRVFSVRQTCNRGPLILNASRVIRLGFLDEVSFIRGNDEHDLNARAYWVGKWVVGFYPINFRAPLEDGASRRQHRKSETAKKFEAAFELARNERARVTSSFLSLVQKSGILGPPEEYNVTDDQLRDHLCPYHWDPDTKWNTSDTT